MGDVISAQLGSSWVELFFVNLLITAAILVVGWWVSTLVGNTVKKVAQRSPRIDRTIVPMVQSVTVWAIRIFVIIAVLARFGVQTASIIAVLGAAGLAVGLALQGTLQNIAAGIMLLALRPIRAGEFVSVVDKGDGTVEEIGLFLTRFTQVDGIQFTLPNSAIWGNAIINYSRNETRRVDVGVSIRYGDDLDKAISILESLVANNEHALSDPEPMVTVMEYRDSTIVINVRVWAKAADYWTLRFALLRQAPVALADAGLRLPVPVREINNAPLEGSEAA